MTFILKLKSNADELNFLDGTTFQLMDGGLNVQLPRKKEVWGGDSIFEHGAELIATSFENRTISLEINIKGTTRDDLIENTNRIERILGEARERSIEQTGSRVEFQYQWDQTASITYFEVIDGELRWPDTTMSVEGVLQQDTDDKYIIRGFSLELTVFPLGYPISPVSGAPSVLPLTNMHGTDVTTGLRVDNRNDANGQNYVEIKAADLDGEQEFLVELDLESDTGEAEQNSKIYIGCRRGDLTFKHILEDNAAAAVFGSPAPTADADYSSGGTYTIVSFADTDGEVELFRWDLSDAEMAATQGAFRFLGRLQEGDFWDQNANYSIAVKYGSTILYQSEWISPLDTTINLLDFGTIYLPPWLVGTPTNLAGLSISLMGEHKSTGTVSLNLDYMALMPQDGGYRILNFRGQGMAQFEHLFDDGWDRVVYHETTGGKKTGLPYGLMRRITLKPNSAQRLYFLMEGTAGSTEITRKMNVIVSAVPSYLVLG